MLQELQNIVEKTNNNPHIINKNSQFVVITYWWGRNNFNQNTARPCVSYFEKLIKIFIKFAINTINTIYINGNLTLETIDKPKIKKYLQNIENTQTFKTILEKKIKEYIYELYKYCKIESNENYKSEKALKYLEKLRETQQTPQEYNFKTESELVPILNVIMKELIITNYDDIFELFLINIKIIELRKNFSERTENLEKIKEQIKDLTLRKKESNDKIKKRVNTPIGENKSVNEQLRGELRYLSPIKYETMIEKWEQECQKNQCNYLAIEYPEFAKPGGYQLAINAKPLFIKKMLNLCEPRGVLYIDGDMYIRKYPSIFDIQDVDFMGRGWWMDPRSSYKMSESIMYDPYTFETSGGTMFFSQSFESKSLINIWINESSKVRQEGKADDRTLSLVFNAKKYLLNMKIIQLPIEYLWLSLDYNERLLEEIYDYNTLQMEETIFIEHPECLTSEDTATGAGASNDRTPAFYKFLDEELTPCSEEFHEYIMFPNKESTNEMKEYLNYMDNTTYFDDGNEELYKKKFVVVDEPELNVQPLYIIKYEDKFGNKKKTYSEEERYSPNEIVEINEKRARNMNTETFGLLTLDNKTIEIQNKWGELNHANGKLNESKVIGLFLRLLKDDKEVIYNPVNEEGYDASIYEKLMEKKETLYKNLDFVFVPVLDSFKFSNFFKPGIKLNQAILLRPHNTILIKLLSMFISLDDLSNYLKYGTYEFISRIRIGYLLKLKISEKNTSVLTGGQSVEQPNTPEEYETALNLMYNNSITFEKNDMNKIKINIEEINRQQLEQKGQGRKKRKKKTIKKGVKNYKKTKKLKKNTMH
jgi:hypothetical protein